MRMMSTYQVTSLSVSEDYVSVCIRLRLGLYQKVTSLSVSRYVSVCLAGGKDRIQHGTLHIFCGWCDWLCAPPLTCKIMLLTLVAQVEF